MVELAVGPAARLVGETTTGHAAGAISGGGTGGFLCREGLSSSPPEGGGSRIAEWQSPTRQARLPEADAGRNYELLDHRREVNQPLLLPVLLSVPGVLWAVDLVRNVSPPATILVSTTLFAYPTPNDAARG